MAVNFDNRYSYIFLETIVKPPGDHNRCSALRIVAHRPVWSQGEGYRHRDYTNKNGSESDVNVQHQKILRRGDSAIISVSFPLLFISPRGGISGFAAALMAWRHQLWKRTEFWGDDGVRYVRICQRTEFASASRDGTSITLVSIRFLQKRSLVGFMTAGFLYLNTNPEFSPRCS